MFPSFLFYFKNLEEGTVSSSGSHGINNPNIAGSIIIPRIVNFIKSITISHMVESSSFESMTLVMWVIAGIGFTRREFERKQPLLS